jgi:tRNA wybutosine-synthesizing protein 2
MKDRSAELKTSARKNEKERHRSKAPAAPFALLHDWTQTFLAEHPPASDPLVLLSSLPKRWSLYPPLILLPQSAFASTEWTEYLTSLPEDTRIQFYANIVSSLKATHLAINAPIQSTAIRSPHINPLYGDFGPLVLDRPVQNDFDSAFWATTVQNGIKQSWAPLYTMFSRGNITEKARVLQFPDVKGQEVADLYIGIGYFAFSYLKAGAKRVWGWDLNAWSVEGLQRGARSNDWSCVVNSEDIKDAKLVVFNEDNVKAAPTLDRYGLKVKHINLGLLPSSEGAWKVATQIMDEKGGWIHVHGNCRDTEIKEWGDRTVAQFQQYFGNSWNVRLAERFRVKEFGPGVGHWVLDLFCSQVTDTT